MRSLVVVLSLFLLFSLQGCAGHSAATAMHKVASPIWIDVRTDEEYQAGHLDAAIHIPYDEIEDRINTLQLAADQPIYLYCGSGRRAGIALETLSGLGYTRLTNMGSFEDAQQWLKASALQTP